VLILHGKSDHIAPVALAEQMTALIPHCRLVLIDGGHLAPLLTQHRRLVSEFGAFLAAGSACMCGQSGEQSLMGCRPVGALEPWRLVEDRAWVIHGV
jgi:hypothetical protein